MRSTLGSALLALVCFSTLACSHDRVAAQPTSLPFGPSSSPPPSVFVEQYGTSLVGFVDPGPSCPAEVGLAPTAFFDDQLLIRLPPEVEGEQIPAAAGLARSPRPLAMGCEPGLSAAVFVARSYHRAAELAGTRRQLFSDLNFPEHVEATILRGSDSDDDVSMSIAFPDNAVWGATQVYLRMFKRHGRTFSVGFITEASSYHRLEPVFAASANTMVAVPN